MLQAIEKETSPREKVYATEPTARVERLRTRYIDTPNKAVIDIARIVTRVLKETEGEPVVTRRAKALVQIERIKIF